MIETIIEQCEKINREHMTHLVVEKSEESKGKYRIRKSGNELLSKEKNLKETLAFLEGFDVGLRSYQIRRFWDDSIRTIG